MVYVGSNDNNIYALDLAGGMASTVTASWHLAAGFTTVRKLTVNAVSRGGSVAVSCTGRGCPFGHKIVRSARRVAEITGLLKGAHLRPGTRVAVWITAPDEPERVVTFTIRRGALPAEMKRSVAVGRPQPQMRPKEPMAGLGSF